MSKSRAEHYDDVTGVILAGGRSTRMGTDKALLQVDGVTLFQIMRRTMKGLFPKMLIAGDRPDLADAHLSCYPDRYPGSALGGIYTGLLNASTPCAFIASCDMPFPDQELIRAIVSHRKGVDAVIPRTPEGLQRCFACYSRSCLPHIKRMLEANDLQVSRLFSCITVHYLDVADVVPNWKHAMQNINTMEDYWKVESKY
jgi:molybdopterin-guanine dinucleotide biosynthesis protein A